MEECIELASTGYGQLSAVITALVIAAVTLYGHRKYNFSGKFFMLLFVATTLATMSAGPRAVRAAECVPAANPNAPLVNAPPASDEPDNEVLARNDGPYTLSALGDQYYVPFLSNDTPGASEFDLSTVDLDPSTPEYDTDLYFYDLDDDEIAVALYDSYFNRVIFYNYNGYYVAGDRIEVLYTVKTVDGRTAGPATITFVIADTIANVDQMITCNTGPTFSPLDNDGDLVHVVDSATVDLNPAVPGIQTEFTSEKGMTYSVNSSGIITMESWDEWKDLNVRDDFLEYTVMTTLGVTSNVTQIIVNSYACA